MIYNIERDKQKRKLDKKVRAKMEKDHNLKWCFKDWLMLAFTIISVVGGAVSIGLAFYHLP